MAERADYVRALREELHACEVHGKTDRVKAIKAELKRVEGKPQGGRSAPAADTETAQA